MTTGKALSSLHDDVWVAAAAQLLVNLTVRKTAVEEVWPRSECEGEQNVEVFIVIIFFFKLLWHSNKLTTANHAYLPTTSLMALVTTPFSTSVRLTAWGRGKRQTSQVIEQPVFLIWYAKWTDAFVPSLLPSVASFQSSCSDFFRTENTRMTMSGVNTARHCRIQTQKKREKSF